MNFLQKIILKAVGSAIPFVDSASLFTLGDKEAQEYYKRWVFACVNTIARSLANVEWVLYKQAKKDIEPVDNHELLSLLYKFNPKFTKYDSLVLTVVYFLLEGEAGWIMMGNGDKRTKKPSEIWVVSPSHLKVTAKDEKGYPTEYEYRVGTFKQTIQAANVLILRNPDPNNPLQGKSVISAIRDTVETDNRMVLWNKNLMANSATPSGALEVPGAINIAEAKKLRKMFEQTYAGYDNAHKVAVLINGMKFTPYSIPPKDLEFVAGRNLNRDEILGVFGVPKILLGLEGEYNRATAETAERVFGKYTLEPIMKMITEQLNEFLVPLYGQELWLEFEPFASEDKELKMMEHTAGHNKWLTTNEIREELGLDPLRGGDSIYQPLTVVPSMTPQAKELTKNSNTRQYLSYKKQFLIRQKINARGFRLENKVSDASSSIIKNLDKKLNKEKVVLKIKKSIAPDKKTEIWQKSVDLIHAYEKTFVEKMTNILTRQRDEILANLEDTKSRRKAKADPKKYLFDVENEISSTISIIEPEYYNALAAGGTMALDLVGADLIDITSLPEVQKWINNITEKYAEEITENTYNSTLEVLQSGINEGKGAQALADDIKTHFADITESRAVAIARTETARAFTAGQAYAWEEVGVTKMEWLTEGSNPCSICTDNSTREWSAKEAQHGTVDYSHPNCECIFLPL